MGGLQTVRFSGSKNFRSRVVLSVLSGRTVVIDNVRPLKVGEGGLRDYEISFVRLVDKLTNGSKVKINETGTSLRFVPGVPIGGEIEHDCPTSRSIGYFVEWILPMAVFSKNPVRIVFRGVTNADLDLSIDALQAATVPILRRVAGVQSNLKLVRRGAEPQGGGEVILSCEVAKNLPPLNLVDTGLVKRIRGVAYSTRVAPSYANRLVDVARGMLNKFSPDVYIFLDHHAKRTGGNSPGFGLSLVAETTSHCLLVADASSSEEEKDPESLASDAAARLLEEIDSNGCIDTNHQSLALVFMAFSQEDVSRIRLGRLSQFTIQFLRDLREFSGLSFDVAPDQDENSVVLSCVGLGYTNYAKRVS